MLFWKSKFHFVGIGGIGMCGLAEILAKRGAQVTGSDVTENANTERLKQLGIKIFKGHADGNVGDVDVVVYSSAINPANPEIQAAQRKKIPLIPRAEALAEMMRLKRGVAIAGTHGKTTTTAMTATIFLHAQANPTVVIGGRMDSLQSTVHDGAGEWLIAEADESDGSFQKFNPEISVITNIDSDHLDYYRDFETLRQAFVNFGLKTAFYGSLIVCGDDTATRKLFQNFSKRVWFYGFDPSNDFVIAGGSGKYSMSWHGKKIGEFDVAVPGRHNGLNATAAILAGMKAGFSFEVCREGLAEFKGVDRRFQLKGEANGISVYDDYGHHPTEVRATLEGFKEKFPNRRVIVLFQPHRFSRTQLCWDEFKSCFAAATEIYLTDIYAAGEQPIEGVNSEKLCEMITHPNKFYLARTDDLGARLKQKLKTGDVFLTLGAGDGWKIGMEILQTLKGS